MHVGNTGVPQATYVRSAGPGVRASTVVFFKFFPRYGTPLPTTTTTPTPTPTT